MLYKWKVQVTGKGFGQKQVACISLCRVELLTMGGKRGKILTMIAMWE